MSLTVLDPGLASRLVDFGRPRTRSLGVPVGGAADRRSLVIANALLGNEDDAAAVEVTLKGPRLRAEADIGCVVYGAPFEIWRDGYPVRSDDTFTLHAGEELRIGGTQWGMRAYLAVRGGFDAPIILRSRSALQTIQRHEVMACASSRIHRRYSAETIPHYPEVFAVKALPGLQSSWFEEEAFYSQMFTVAPASDRMGLRLSGQALTMPQREMTSEPVCPGSVQVTRDGQCIVLGVDGQTIGGYPKVAQIIRPHLDLLGQARPGQKIKFVRTTMAKALELEREAQTSLRQLVLRLRLSLDAFPQDRRVSSSLAQTGKDF